MPTMADNCPTCGRFCSGGWQTDGGAPDYVLFWGATCTIHGKWSESE